ncbi:MAG: hypothetical protein ACE5GO_09965, partial [Anaerolineales bacterium]
MTGGDKSLAVGEEDGAQVSLGGEPVDLIQLLGVSLEEGGDPLVEGQPGAQQGGVPGQVFGGVPQVGVDVLVEPFADAVDTSAFLTKR